jgi:hypothetical protein
MLILVVVGALTVLRVLLPLFHIVKAYSKSKINSRSVIAKEIMTPMFPIVCGEVDLRTTVLFRPAPL